MKTVSIRFGFATNSSSYHSLVQGTPTWSNLSRQEIIEKYLANQNPSFRPAYGEGMEDISEMDDIVTYALYSLVLEDLDSYAYYGRDHNISEYEFELLTKGFSSDIIELVRKLEPYFSEVYVSDDTSSAYRFADKFKSKEEAFWNFIYGVSCITEG
jgi:hypothetical protein